MKLEYLMTYHADLAPPTEIGAAPSGVRRIFDVQGGTFEGPRLKGRILPSGADWLLIGSDGVGRLDVRATFETDDDARIYMQYHGVLVLSPGILDALERGQGFDFGATYFMTQPRFETGDARYAWLNALVAVAEGRALPGAVEYRVFAIQNV